MSIVTLSTKQMADPLAEELSSLKAQLEQVTRERDGARAESDQRRSNAIAEQERLSNRVNEVDRELRAQLEAAHAGAAALRAGLEAATLTHDERCSLMGKDGTRCDCGRDEARRPLHDTTAVGLGPEGVAQLRAQLEAAHAGAAALRTALESFGCQREQAGQFSCEKQAMFLSPLPGEKCEVCEALASDAGRGYVKREVAEKVAEVLEQLAQVDTFDAEVPWEENKTPADMARAALALLRERK